MSEAAPSYGHSGRSQDAPQAASRKVAQVEKQLATAMGLSGKTWGGLLSIFATALVSAGAWVESVRSDITAAKNDAAGVRAELAEAIKKIDGLAAQNVTLLTEVKLSVGEMKGLNRRVSRLEDRFENITRGRKQSDDDTDGG